MLRGRLFAMALLLLGTIGICAAQETADITVGSEVVARVRETASYESVEHRAAAIDEKINEVLAATNDPASLEVTLEQVDGLWTILIDGTAIMSVWPAEAAANELSPEMLGASWVRRFKDALPSATAAPVTEISEPVAAPVQPLTIADEPVLSSPTDDERAGHTLGSPTPPPARETMVIDTRDVVEIIEVPRETTNEPEQIVAGQGARLLMLEAFNTARELPEDAYLVRREAMADELFNSLVEVMSGGRVTGRIEESATAPTTPEPLEIPPTVAHATIDTGPVAADTTRPATPPATVGAAPSLEMSGEARARINARIPANDPSYANVLQKVAIKAKFRAASNALQTCTDPSISAQAREVLTGARRANGDGDFDTAERYLNTGLNLLRVTEWEQHIDAAMTDLGLTK